MIIDERNFVEFEDEDYLDAVEYSRKMRSALNAEFDHINLQIKDNAIKQRVEQVKQVQIQSSGAVLQDIEIFGESTQEDENIISVGSNINFLNLEDIEETTNAKGITYSYKNGIFTLNGKSTGPHYITFPKVFSLEKGAYTYSTTVIGGKYLGDVYHFGKQLNNGSNLLFNGGTALETKTGTITENANQVKCSFYLGGTAEFNNYKIKLKIEKGTKKTGYTDYNYGGVDYICTNAKGKNFSTTIQLPSEVELCKIGEMQDYLDNNGVIHKNTKKIILDGTENWYVYANYTGQGYCYYLEDNNFPLVPINSVNYKYSMCTHFKNEYAVWTGNSTIGSYSDHATVYRKYFITDKATLQEFKEWLSENKPELIYTLEEEDTTQSLEESEIEKLQNLKTFVGTNNIEISAPTSFNYNYNYNINDLLDRIATLESKIAELLESGVSE